MSAPRKIWVPVPVTDEGPCYVDKDEAEMQWGCTAVVYHHDDVVRELVEALEPFEAMAALYDPDDGDSDQQAWAYGARPTIGQLRHARAALAKIAQEG